jgi:hypothetical protein
MPLNLVAHSFVVRALLCTFFGCVTVPDDYQFNVYGDDRGHLRLSVESRERWGNVLGLGESKEMRRRFNHGKQAWSVGAVSHEADLRAWADLFCSDALQVLRVRDDLPRITHSQRPAFMRHVFAWVLLLHSPLTEVRWTSQLGFGIYMSRQSSQRCVSAHTVLHVRGQLVRLSGAALLQLQAGDRMFSVVQLDDDSWHAVTGPLALVNGSCPKHVNALAAGIRGDMDYRELRVLPDAVHHLQQVGQQVVISYGDKHKVTCQGCAAQTRRKSRRAPKRPSDDAAQDVANKRTKITRR